MKMDMIIPKQGGFLENVKKKLLKTASKQKSRLKTHLWLDARCIWKRTANMALKINIIFPD